METKNNKTIISTSPLIYYTKYGNHLEFYHETFDTLVDSLNSYNHLGIELAKEKKLKESRNAFLKALYIDPSNVVILNNLGNLERFTKNFKKSVEYYKKSFTKSDFLYVVAGLNLAKILDFLGERTPSEKVYTTIITNSRLAFIRGVAYYQLTEKYLRYGEIEKGINTFNRAKKLLKRYSDFSQDLTKLQRKLTRSQNI